MSRPQQEAVLAEVLAEVRAQLRHHESEVANLQAVERFLVSRSVQPPANNQLNLQSAVTSAITSKLSHVGPAPAIGPYAGMTQTQAAEAVLKASGRPMRAPEIMEAMLAGGFPEPTKRRNLSNSIFTALSRDGQRFKKDTPGLFELRQDSQTNPT